MNDKSNKIRIFLLGILIVSIIVGFALTVKKYVPLLVATGSMEPKIPQGSLIFIKKGQRIELGNVITYKTPTGSLVTHRVVETENISWEKVYRTKGDANEFTDNFLVGSDDIEGKVVLVLPYFGYVLKYLVSPLSMFFFFYVPIGWAIGSTIKKFVNPITP